MGRQNSDHRYVTLQVTPPRGDPLFGVGVLQRVAQCSIAPTRDTMHDAPTGSRQRSEISGRGLPVPEDVTGVNRE